MTPTPETEKHNPLPACERDRLSPVWDMSQERVFMEQLLNQRFNFFLAIFTLVIAGSVNAKQQLHLHVILWLGFAIELALASLLARSQEKLDLTLEDLFSDPSHPVTIINGRAKLGGSRRRLVGIWVPRVCCVILFIAAVLAAFGTLHVATNAT